MKYLVFYHSVSESVSYLVTGDPSFVKFNGTFIGGGYENEDDLSDLLFDGEGEGVLQFPFKNIDDDETPLVIDGPVTIIHIGIIL